jgi:GntR family transcriptional regulator
MLKPGKPRHEQISDWLREQIQEGVYAADSQIPSESQLTDRFDVSRITVRRALQTLENEGLIYRRQGLGSFVKDTRVRQGLVRLTDFIEDMAQAGLAASSTVLHFGQEKAAADVAKALGVAEGQIVFRLDRLRLGDGEPIAFDQTWMSVFYAGLLSDHDLEQETIYRILENHYGITVEQGRYRIKAVNADPEVARHLAVPRGRALLLIERTSFTHSDKQIYYQRRYYRSDRVTYDLELERRPLKPSACLSGNAPRAGCRSRYDRPACRGTTLHPARRRGSDARAPC